MPRPPRAKVASRVAKTTNAKTAMTKMPTKAAAKKTRQVSDAINTLSEDGDVPVIISRSMRSKKRTPEEKTPEPKSNNEIVLSSGIPEASASAQRAVSTARTPNARGAKQTSRTQNSERGLAKKSSATPLSASRRSARTNPPDEVIHVEDSSGFDLTLSSLDSNSPAHGTRPPSAMKVGATPAQERSILALTNFKRRARQPSLLRMVQQTTDVEDNDENSGLDNTDNFDFDDFLPHAESTPLNTRKSLPEEDTRNDSGTHISSSGSRGTKRKLSPEVQVPRSSPPFSQASGADVDSARSPSPSLPEVFPSREEVVEQTQEASSEIPSETYASPKSSSPIHEDPKPQSSPAQRQMKRRGRTAKSPVYDEDPEGDETETPAKNRRKTTKKSEPALNTAQLKGLLPRRRNRRQDQDEFDIDTAEDTTPLDSDQDELQMPMRRTRRPGAGKLASPKAAKKIARGKKSAPAKTAVKASRTYSRRISSDKENGADMPAEEEEEEVDETSIIEHSEKIAAIRKKFAEVDAFELEFEDVDAITSSSPYR